jgi:hippurate hydrolase
VDLGKAVIQREVSMAAADMFSLTITGKGGHAAMPHTTIDPIVAGAAVVDAYQAFVSRRVDPLDSVVVSITQFHAGTTHNVIPDTAEIAGTARYLRKESGAFIEERLRHLAETVAAAHDCSAHLEWEYGYPPTVNHAAEAERAATVMEEVLGSQSVIFDAPPSMTGEDFSYMLEARPGAYVWLGAGEDSLMLHNAKYDFNDELLPLGASYWAQLVESELSR